MRRGLAGRRPSLVGAGAARRRLRRQGRRAGAAAARSASPTGGLQIVPGGPSWFHPGRSATLQFGPKAIVGHFGELHPRALKALDVEGPIAAFEIILDALPAPKAKPTKIKPKLELSDLQPVSRDFAFIVDRAAPAGDLVKAVQGADRALIADVSRLRRL